MNEMRELTDTEMEAVGGAGWGYVFASAITGALVGAVAGSAIPILGNGAGLIGGFAAGLVGGAAHEFL